MKAFLLACVVIVVMAVGADVVLNGMGFSSEEVFQRDSVRLGD